MSLNRNQLVMIYGSDYEAMTVKLCEAIDLREMIGDRSKRVALKPNLVTGGKASEGGVTHPEIVAGVLQYLQQNGFADLIVMEGSWVGARTMQAAREAGILQTAQRFQVPFIDLQQDRFHTVHAPQMDLKICDEVDKVDFLIDLPVLKGHCQTRMTCALKNLKGLIPNTEKRRFHTLGLHKPIANLAAVLKPDLILVDNICGDLDFEEGGNPVVMNRILACADPVLCDAFACAAMGISPEEVPYLKMAEKLGVGSSDLSKAEICALNEAQTARSPGMSRRIQKLEKYVQARDACSACYGSLIHALDKLDRDGDLQGHRETICIGQGYRETLGTGQSKDALAEGIGIGNCTKQCVRSLKGCPPTAGEILEFLRENWD